MLSGCCKHGSGVLQGWHKGGFKGASRVATGVASRVASRVATRVGFKGASRVASRVLQMGVIIFSIQIIIIILKENVAPKFLCKM